MPRELHWAPRPERIKIVNRLLYGERIGRARFHRWKMWAHYDWACKTVPALRKELIAVRDHLIHDPEHCFCAKCIVHRIEADAFNRVRV